MLRRESAPFPKEADVVEALLLGMVVVARNGSGSLEHLKEPLITSGPFGRVR